VSKQAMGDAHNNPSHGCEFINTTSHAVGNSTASTRFFMIMNM